ncbi:MAG: hypothetical protein AAF197_00360 [Pseudomonadota bacterium]
MFGGGEIYSKERIQDPISGNRIPVVLNPKMEIADPQLPARERVNVYVKFIREQAATYCLFTPTGLKVSRVGGVSLSSQIESIAVAHLLENESVLAQFGNVYYIANLSSGFVINELLVPIEQFDSSDLFTQDVVALPTVQGAEQMGIRVIDARIALTGRGVAKSHVFLKETKAFSVAGFRHPAQLRRLLILVASIVIALVSLYLYQSYLEEQRRQEQQRKAAVIPPKVGKDSSVEQLRTYADWLAEHLPYYERNGLQNIELKSTTAFMRGAVAPKLMMSFYEHHKSMKNLPVYNVSIVPGSQGVAALNKSTWELQLGLDREIAGVEQFGLEIYENYILTVQSFLERQRFQASSQTPSLNAYGIKEGVFQISGEYHSPSQLYELANGMIGIPSYANSVSIAIGVEGRKQLSIEIKIVGRG